MSDWWWTLRKETCAHCLNLLDNGGEWHCAAARKGSNYMTAFTAARLTCGPNARWFKPKKGSA